MSRLKMAGAGGACAALAALCVATVGSFEGLRTSTYRDSVGIPTICYGETLNVRMGQRYTKPQCDAMLIKRLDHFADKVEACVTRKMGDDVYAAFVSLAYNIGPSAFCKSTAVRLYNAGERRASCRAILKFDRAGGRVLAGLTRRREAERDLCLKGV